MENKFPERAKIARKESGKKLKEITDYLGIARSTLWKYEQGERKPDIDVVRKMSEIYDVPIDWLSGVSQVKESPASYLPSNAKPIGKTIPVPLLGTIPAGLATEIYENILCFIETPEDQVKNGDYFYLQVKGDSMKNSRIEDGDFVLVRKQPNVENGEIAVVRTNESEGTLKRVKKVDGQYILYPDNPKYDPIMIKSEYAQIIGKVIKVEFDPNVRR